MRSVKIIALVLSFALLVSAFVSCAGKEDEGTTTSGEEVTTEKGNTEVEPVLLDYMNTDLSKYLTLGKYLGLTIHVDGISVSDEDVESEINSEIEKAKLNEKIYDRTAESGDTVFVSYVGYIDGVQFEGGTSPGSEIKLVGNSGYIPGFTEGIIGMTPGETKNIEVTFPENYHNAAYAGVDAVFVMTLIYIKDVKPLDDEVTLTISGGKFDSAEEYREYIRGELEKAAAETLEANKAETLWLQVIDNATLIKYDEGSVEYYYRSQREQYEAYASYYQMSYESYLAAIGYNDSYLRQYAELCAKEDLVYYSIVKDGNYSISDEEYRAGLADFALSLEMSAEEIEKQYGKDTVCNALLWDKVIDIIFDSATFIID